MSVSKEDFFQEKSSKIVPQKIVLLYNPHRLFSAKI